MTVSAHVLGLCRGVPFVAATFARRPGCGDVAQDSGEPRDCRRVFNPFRESVFDSRAPRIVRTGLPDGFQFLVAQGGLLCPAAREGLDGTIGGTITHNDSA